MGQIRVKQSNVEAALAAFGGGRVVAPHTTWANGCCDPSCCWQHDGTIGGEPAVGIELPDGMSGNEANRRLVAAGVVKKGYAYARK